MWYGRKNTRPRMILNSFHPFMIISFYMQKMHPFGVQIYLIEATNLTKNILILIMTQEAIGIQQIYP